MKKRKVGKDPYEKWAPRHYEVGGGARPTFSAISLNDCARDYADLLMEQRDWSDGTLAARIGLSRTALRERLADKVAFNLLEFSQLCGAVGKRPDVVISLHPAFSVDNSIPVLDGVPEEFRDVLRVALDDGILGQILDIYSASGNLKSVRASLDGLAIAVEQASENRRVTSIQAKRKPKAAAPVQKKKAPSA